jgi:hypothetical protein
LLFESCYLFCADLLDSYRKEKRLSGVLFLHRISDTRIGGPALLTLRMMGKLCGDKAMRNFIFVTTMWQRLLTEDEGGRREVELKEFWKPYLDCDAQMRSFKAIDDYKDAWEIVDSLLRPNHDLTPLLIQEEVVNNKMIVPQTKAAALITNRLQGSKEDLGVQNRWLKKRLKSETDPEKREELEREHAELQKQIKGVKDDLNKQNIPFLSRIRGLHPFRVQTAVSWLFSNPYMLSQSPLSVRSGPLTDTGSDTQHFLPIETCVKSGSLFTNGSHLPARARRILFC